MKKETISINDKIRIAQIIELTDRKTLKKEMKNFNRDKISIIESIAYWNGYIDALKEIKK